MDKKTIDLIQSTINLLCGKHKDGISFNEYAQGIPKDQRIEGGWEIVTKHLVGMDIVQFDNTGHAIRRKHGIDNFCGNKFIEHIDQVRKEAELQQEGAAKAKSEQSENEALKKRNLILSNNELEHKQTIRGQEQRIRDLEERVKFFSVLKGYWWLWTLGIGIGVLIGKFLVQQH